MSGLHSRSPDAWVVIQKMAAFVPSFKKVSPCAGAGIVTPE